MNHYPKHIGDWMRDTAHLTEVEECVYSRCLDQYYAREKPLPVDVGQCARLVRALTAVARKALDAILPEFFVLQADGWHQKRCDAELAVYHERSESAKRSASFRVYERHANAQPTHKQKDANAHANASETHAERNANHKPVANSQEPEAKNQNQKQKGKNKGAAAPLPDWLPQKAWADFAEMRKRKGKPMTSRAAELVIEKLATLRSQGHDPQALLDAAVVGVWTTVWPPKERINGLSDAGSRTARNLENWQRNEEAKDSHEG